MKNQQIAVVNQTTAIDATSLMKMVRACQRQLREHVAPTWMRVPADILIFPTLESVPADHWIVVMLDDSDEANALGYHFETPDGRVYSRVFARTILNHGGTLLTGANSVSVTLSHEIVEMFADPNINTWADNGADEMLAWELGDPVEATSYDIDGVAVSNFVFMSYFDMQNKTGPYDMLGLLKAPWTMLSGGYQIRRNKAGETAAVFGNEMPEWKKASKAFPAARTQRRAVNTAVDLV